MQISQLPDRYNGITLGRGVSTAKLMEKKGSILCTMHNRRGLVVLGESGNCGVIGQNEIILVSARAEKSFFEGI